MIKERDELERDTPGTVSAEELSQKISVYIAEVCSRYISKKYINFNEKVRSATEGMEKSVKDSSDIHKQRKKTNSKREEQIEIRYLEWDLLGYFHAKFLSFSEEE